MVDGTRGKVWGVIAVVGVAVALWCAWRDLRARSMDNKHGDPRPTSTRFVLDSDEVTVRDYSVCVAAGSCDLAGMEAGRWDACNWEKAGREMHPINCVSIEQARSYCNFANGRLPTDTEWLADGPTVDEVADAYSRLRPACLHVNGTCRSGDRVDVVRGRRNMIGNVAEWVEVPLVERESAHGAAAEGAIGGWYYMSIIDVAGSLRPSSVGRVGRAPTVGVRCMSMR